MSLDYQPTVTLPVSLARQLHAYLIGSIIDQAEENEDLVNQLSVEGAFRFSFPAIAVSPSQATLEKAKAIPFAELS